MHKYTLYGDGIHDDTDAIQEMLESGACEVALPAPAAHYLISRPLIMPSKCKLKLPRFAEIRLADGANCFMLQNKTVEKKADRQRDSIDLRHKTVWYFVDELSPDAEDTCHDFEIEGGIWNFNNQKQEPNPFQTNQFDERHYLGHLMFFYNVKNFRLSNMTFKDPANYAVMIESGSYFTIENICFDFNLGNPYAVNMDGIHLNGNCHFGVIRNLHGACYDDLVALNAHEGLGGDITNIQIDGLFADGCHSAVRLLTVENKIQHITISNVFGTYYQYAIGFTKYYPGNTTGYFDAIELSNLHIAKAKRLPVQEIHMGNNKDYHFPLIWIQEETVIKHLSIEHLHRREFVNPIETICIDQGAIVNDLKINDLSLENHTDAYCSLLCNRGKIEKLSHPGLSMDEIDNHGSIDHSI
ncbi:MAG: hypothetical protein IJE17_10315 [Clostridia bacterium]|nr:hypothetical protein [Clostridia bacterium]